MNINEFGSLSIRVYLVDLIDILARTSCTIATPRQLSTDEPQYLRTNASTLTWHNSVTDRDNWVKCCNFAQGYMWTSVDEPTSATSTVCRLSINSWPTFSPYLYNRVLSELTCCNSLSHSRLACSRLSAHIQPSVNNPDTNGAANSVVVSIYNGHELS